VESLVVSEKTICSIIILCAAFISTSARAQVTYSQTRQAGINYIIATIGIEELRLTECGYVLKKLHIEPFDNKRAVVLSKFTEADKLEAKQRMLELHIELKSFFGEAIAKFKKSTDAKTACGMVAGEALRNLGVAQENLNKIAGIS
jgi:hypothetical protein